MIAQTISAALIVLFLVPSTSNAQYDEENYVPYESIIDDLSKKAQDGPSGRGISRGRRSFSPPSSDPFENIWIHAGVGLVQTTQNLSLPNGQETTMAGRGVQATLGIDILDPSLTAEGSMRSFGESSETSSQISLKEFDLKLLLKSRSLSTSNSSRLHFKAGAGLTGRYMTVRSLESVYEITTPSSVLVLGGDLYFNDRISLGLDISARNAMISESFDQTSYDGTIRLDTHF